MPQTMHDNIPDFCKNETNSTIRDGDWNDPTVWSARRVPSPIDVGCIRNSLQAASVADVGSYCIEDGGSLNFPVWTSSVFRFNNFMLMGGALTCLGLPDNNKLQFIVKDNPLDLVNDPQQWGQGLIGMSGTAQLFGNTAEKMFLRLAKAPKAGDTVLLLAETPNGWRPGARIFLPDTVNDKYTAGTYKGEACVIQTFVSMGIKLASPLLYDHPGSRDEKGNVEFLPHVRYLTTNITIESEHPYGTRGHTAFMGRFWEDFDGVGFIGLGRTRAMDKLNSTIFNDDGTVAHIGTNQIGRYAFHNHHLRGPLGLGAGTPQWRARRIVIDGSPKIGLTVHDSHYGLLENSVIHDCMGAGIFEEQSNEYRNVYRNIAGSKFFGTDNAPYSRINVKPDPDFANEGTFIWVRGPGMGTFENIVGSNASRSGIILANLGITDLQRIPAWKGADPDVEGEYTLVDPRITPSYSTGNVGSVLEFYGAMDMGLDVWNVGQLDHFKPGVDVPESVYRNVRSWRVRDDVTLRGNHLTLDGLVSRGTWNGKSGRGIANMDGRVLRNAVVRNLDIQGKALGIDTPTLTDFSMDLGGGEALAFQIQNVHLTNVINIGISPPGNFGTGGYFDASLFPPKRIEIDNATFGTWTGAALIPGTVTGNIVLGWPDLNAQQQATNVVVRDEIVVSQYNGVAGDSFHLFYPQQAASFVLPQTVLSVGIYPVKLQACPVADLTNDQAMMQYGIAAAGRVAPSSAHTRPGIVGLVS